MSLDKYEPDDYVWASTHQRNGNKSHWVKGKGCKLKLLFRIYQMLMYFDKI